MQRLWSAEELFTLKNAAAGLPHGGGKSVTFGDPKMPLCDKERLIRVQLIGKDSFETSAAQVTAELLRRGFGPDERVTIIIGAVEGAATTRQKSQVCVVAAGRAGGDNGGAIEQPNLAERIRRRFAPFGGVDLELPPREVVDAPSSF